MKEPEPRNQKPIFHRKDAKRAKEGKDKEGFIHEEHEREKGAKTPEPLMHAVHAIIFIVILNEAKNLVGAHGDAPALPAFTVLPRAMGSVVLTPSGRSRRKAN